MHPSISCHPISCTLSCGCCLSLSQLSWGEDRVTSLVNHRGYNYLRSHLWAVSCCQLAWSTCIWTVEVSQSILKIHTDSLITQKLSFMGKTGIDPLSPICKVTANTQMTLSPWSLQTCCISLKMVLVSFQRAAIPFKEAECSVAKSLWPFN